MKKALVVILVLCLGFGATGCSGYTTVKGPGYSFEINAKWEMEKYDDETRYYYPNGKNNFSTRLRVYETTFSYEKSLDGQYDSILNIWLDDYVSDDGKFTIKHTNIQKGKIGAYAFVTADIETSGTYVSYTKALCFYSSPTQFMMFEFTSENKSDLNKYSKDIDRLFKSVKLT